MFRLLNIETFRKQSIAKNHIVSFDFNKDLKKRTKMKVMFG
jgi:hypothetical protein